jgi:hypothetical protein
MKKRYALRDDQWEKIKALLLAKKVGLGAKREIIGYSSMQCYTDTVPVFRGEIYQNGSEIGKIHIEDGLVGQKQAFGKKSSNTWPLMPTMSTG